MNPNTPRTKAALARCKKAIKETPWKDVVIAPPLNPDPEQNARDNHYWLHGSSKSNFTGD